MLVGQAESFGSAPAPADEQDHFDQTELTQANQPETAPGLTYTHDSGETHRVADSSAVFTKDGCPHLSEVYQRDPKKAHAMLGLAALGQSLKFNKPEAEPATPKTPEPSKRENQQPKTATPTPRTEYHTTEKTAQERLQKIALPTEVATKSIPAAVLETIPIEPFVSSFVPAEEKAAQVQLDAWTRPVALEHEEIAVATPLKTEDFRIQSASHEQNINQEEPETPGYYAEAAQEPSAERLHLEQITAEQSVPTSPHTISEETPSYNRQPMEVKEEISTYEPQVTDIDDTLHTSEIATLTTENQAEEAVLQPEAPQMAVEQVSIDIAEAIEEFVAAQPAPEVAAEMHQALVSLENALNQVEALQDDPELIDILRLEDVELVAADVLESDDILESQSILPSAAETSDEASVEDAVSAAATEQPLTVEAATTAAFTAELTDRSELVQKIAEATRTVISPEAEAKVEATIENLIVALQQVYETAGKPYEIEELRQTAKRLVVNKLQAMAEIQAAERSDSFDRGTHENLIRLIGQVRQLRISSDGIHRFIGQFALFRLHSIDAQPMAA